MRAEHLALYSVIAADDSHGTSPVCRPIDPGVNGVAGVAEPHLDHLAVLAKETAGFNAWVEKTILVVRRPEMHGEGHWGGR